MRVLGCVVVAALYVVATANLLHTVAGLAVRKLVLAGDPVRRRDARKRRSESRAEGLFLREE
ncbi:unnamed protein product [Gemmata massiliana]|uniref:Uncharacterized protein n=1 Tax=Gemmata massiliana TaxID=1210884 RepID=A0A6P2CV78_9BACT|nr:unnamed protein product [Gemmata massiliana]